MIIAPGAAISGFMTAGHLAGLLHDRRGPRLLKSEMSVKGPNMSAFATGPDKLFHE